MATTQELIQQLNAVKAEQQASADQIVKIGTEIDGLQKTVQDLKDALANQTAPSQELVDAVNAVVAGSSAVKAATQADDDKVPDA